jgi:hypothetical protein
MIVLYGIDGSHGHVTCNRGRNGRRHEVDFGDSSIRVEIYASQETVEIFVEADETLPEDRRRFAIAKHPERRRVGAARKSS